MFAFCKSLLWMSRKQQEDWGWKTGLRFAHHGPAKSLGFIRTLLGLSLLFFCDGYRGDTKTSFGFKEEVIHFSRNTGSEAPPHPVAGVCLLNVTTRPRACHLMLCLPLRSRRSPFSMQRERVRDSRLPRACCGELPTELISFLLHVLAL